MPSEGLRRRDVRAYEILDHVNMLPCLERLRTYESETELRVLTQLSHC